jgi:hypothetical protein
VKSLLKSLAFAVATLTFSTWALGSLWLHAEAASDDTADANYDGSVSTRSLRSAASGHSGMPAASTR